MQLTQTEANFLAQTILAWADAQPVVAGVPLMHTDATGEKCLLTQDQIESLYKRLEYHQ